MEAGRLSYENSEKNDKDIYYGCFYENWFYSSFEENIIRGIELLEGWKKDTPEKDVLEDFKKCINRCLKIKNYDNCGNVYYRNLTTLQNVMEDVMICISGEDSYVFKMIELLTHFGGKVGAEYCERRRKIFLKPVLEQKS